MEEITEETKELNNKQKKFCSEYIYDWNKTRAYKIAYPDCKTNEAAAVCAVKLLRNANVKEYIEEIQKDLEKQAGISRFMVLEEHMKLAFSNIANLHNTWIERKEFEGLSDNEKACIESIDTKILRKNVGTQHKPEIVDVEYVKIKLYSKQSALDSISKMLGYNEPDKLDIKIKDKIKGITFNE